MYLSFFSLSFSGQPGQQSPQFCKFSFLLLLLLLLLLIIIRSGLLTEIRWSVYLSKSHWSLCVSFSRTDAGLCIYHLFVWSNLNFLHISQWITLPTQSCLVLYSSCANLLHSLMMWLMVSSLSWDNLHLLFCCVLSIFVLIWLVLMALLCAAIRRDSVSLLKFPFLSHIQVFSCEVLFISSLKRLELFFFQFFFPSYCPSVGHRVASIVSGGCNESSIVFLYIVFESLYRCVNAVFNTGKSSSSLFSWYI